MKAETKYLPMIIYMIFSHLRHELDTGKINSNSIIYAFFDMDNPEVFKIKWKDLKTQLPEFKVIKK